MKLLPALLPVLLVSSIAFDAKSADSTESIRFSMPPKVTTIKSGAIVTFTVSKRTDVEVSVLDARGQVIRHLAAGVLGGENRPPSPLKPGLSQRLVWDGNDDTGNKAKGGPFTIRVRAGMRVKLGRMIGGSPYTGSITTMPYRAPVNGLAVDNKGRLFVKMMSSVGSHGNSGMWPWHLRRFDRDGKYVKTLRPYPPSTPVGKAADVTLLKAGAFTPANQNSLYPVFSVLGNEIVPRVINGQLVYVHSEKRRLNFFALDGSNRVRAVTMWPASAKLKCPRWLDIQVAISPDGKWAYYSNVAGTAYDGKTPADIDPKWPQGRIYRQDLTTSGAIPQPFFDLKQPDWSKTKYWMPSAWDKKTAAAGIDVDANGNVFVCDLVNGQVVEIGPDGKQRSATTVPWPDKVLVSRKTDALFVISRKVSRGQLPVATLYKLTGRGKTARIVARLPLKGTIGGACTLDESGKSPVLWLAGRNGKRKKGGESLIRIEDRDGKLVVTGDRFLNRDRNAITFAGYMDVDREAELVYVTGNDGTIWRFHGETGKGGPLKIKGVDVAIGPGGNVFTWGATSHWQGPVTRYSRDLKPVPLRSGKHTYGYLYGRAGRGYSVCGLDVDAKGRVFATWGSNNCHVQGYDADGKPIDVGRKLRINTPRGPQQVSAVVAGVRGYGGSLRVDRAGNLYILQQGVPKSFKPPAGFEKDDAWRRAVGTIYKFPPTGGTFQHSRDRVTEATGSTMKYPGCGPISRWRAAGACACTKPRFDVDDFGRIYIPNGITYTVSVRDNANNEIVRFGAYGNFDCQGKNSGEPKPVIPLGWPVSAGASDRFIYVGDTLNHRVVRADKSWTVEVISTVANSRGSAK